MLGDATMSRVATWLTPARVKAYAPTLAVVMAVGWAATRAQFHQEGQRLTTDFVAFHTAGRAALEGRPEDFYDLHAQQRAQQITLNAAVGVNAFLNPPLVAALYAPLGALDYGVALGVWWLLSALCLAFALRLLARELRLKFSWVVVCTLCFWPMLAAFAYGQNTALSLLILCAFLVRLRRGQDLAAGLLLGLLVYKPQLAIGAGLLLILARRFRAAGAALGVALAFALLNLALFPEASAAFATSIREGFAAVGSEAFPVWGEMSFMAAGRLLVPGLAGSILGVVFSVGAAGWLARGWLRAEWRPATREWDLSLAASWPVAILLAPHLFEYDLALVLPAWFLAASRLGSRPEGAVLGWSATVFLFATVGLFLAAASVASWGFAVQLPVLALVGWSAAVWHARCVAPPHALPPTRPPGVGPR